MGRRKRREDAPLSLFSFQDIMACLTGILILVALLLAVDGLSDEMRPGAAPAVPGLDAVALRERVAKLTRTLSDRAGGRDVTRAEVDMLDERIRQLTEQSDRTRLRIEKANRERELATAEAREVDSRIKSLEERRSESLNAALRERVRFRPGERIGMEVLFVEVASRGLSLGRLNEATRIPERLELLEGVGAEEALQKRLTPKVGKASLVFVVHDDAVPAATSMVKFYSERGFGTNVGWQLWDRAGGGFLDGAPVASGTEVPGAVPPAEGADR